MSSVLNHARSLSGTPRRRACLLIKSRLDKENPRTNSFALNSRHSFAPAFRPGSLRSFQSAALLNVPASRPIEILPPQENRLPSQTSDGSTAVDHHAPAYPVAKADTGNKKTKLVPASANIEAKPKKIKPKPAEYLTKALRNGGHSLGHGDQLTSIDCAPHKFAPGNRNEQKTAGRPKKPSLPVILGEYIREIDPLLSLAPSARVEKDLDDALQLVFRDTNSDYLASRGYTCTDVTSWAWVLTSRSPHEAAVRLFSLETDKARSDSTGPAIPPFITLHLLRQQDIDAHTFRLLLIHSLHLMSGQPLPPSDSPALPVEMDPEPLPNNSYISLDLGTCMILVARLIRHARRVWPPALLAVARAFAQFITLPRRNAARGSAEEGSHDDRVKTEKLNECLWLLSLPTNISPYRSTPIQQQAQFELLRSMAAHKPVLPVTRQGYRAVVAIQLAHKKTFEERQSAELKAPSWPPWKEEKLGIDSLRGNDGMFSRAMQVLSQMADAGYSRRLWEDISSILAGWDTDHSPTVQTRAVVRRPHSLPDTQAFKPNHHEIWVARIRATRTIREAWACFLAYENQNLPPKGAIFAAMGEKLVYQKTAVEHRFDYAGSALPGDGREVHPEPASARDIIYVPTEPPTLDEFLEQMLAHGFRPSGRFLSLLLQSASSMHSGLRYLTYSDLTDSQVATLTMVQADTRKYLTIDLESFHAVPDSIFASFVKLMCAHSTIATSVVHSHNILTADRFPALVAHGHPDGRNIDLLAHAREHPEDNRYPLALWHAIQLTNLRRSPYPPAWKHILSTLARGNFGGIHGSRTQSLQRILAWHQILKILGWMRQRDVELGDHGFQTLCVAFTKAIDAAYRYPGTAEQSFLLIHKARIRRLKDTDEGDNDFEAFLQHALQVLKHQFDYLVLPASKTSVHAERSVFAVSGASDVHPSVPSILHTPSPATLHAFVRAMGLIGDDEGLLHLLQWMSQSADVLRDAADEHSNGDRMMHRTLVAIRVFLERRHERTVDHRVPSDVVQEAYDLVRRTGWDWPSDAEVEDYCL
ncbi:hypothetical protein N7541_010534 [Penicillium brevicompactum]|uniref:Uncharacterized protein n=1 Tax=Penicillium brevicompactum TaxID=5074 RepID=A0A9W9QQ46_PENBR|nr:hypothetical protein N7541_010534 [Penicillium brevicompactum]